MEKGLGRLEDFVESRLGLLNGLLILLSGGVLLGKRSINGLQSGGEAFHVFFDLSLFLFLLVDQLLNLALLLSDGFHHIDELLIGVF